MLFAYEKQLVLVKRGPLMRFTCPNYKELKSECIAVDQAKMKMMQRAEKLPTYPQQPQISAWGKLSQN